MATVPDGTREFQLILDALQFCSESATATRLVPDEELERGCVREGASEDDRDPWSETRRAVDFRHRP
jgi:hypothetical protein